MTEKCVCAFSAGQDDPHQGISAGQWAVSAGH